MASITGGITGRPRGKVAGIVFGSARTRRGKVVTARELVPPSNPNTAGQQIQRTNFYVATEAVKSLTPDIYQAPFNRSVGQLPGYQSMVSTIVRNMNADGELSAPAPLPIGPLDGLVQLAVSDAQGPGNVTVSWVPTVTGQGAGTDQVTIFAIESTPAEPGKKPRNVYRFPLVATRADEAADINLPGAAGEYTFCAYVQKAGVSVPVFGPAEFQNAVLT